MVDGEEVLCPFFDQCGYQRQKQPAHIWFTAHEMLVHGVPDVFGDATAVILVDEDPLDAFFFGIEGTYTVPLDALTAMPRIEDDEVCEKLMQVRLKLHEALVTLPEGPVRLTTLGRFHEATEMSRLEWKAKVDVEIMPDWEPVRCEGGIGGSSTQQGGHTTGRAMAADCKSR